MEKTIFMAQMGIVQSPDILRTTLGSCVGIILQDAQSGLYGLAHIMLPFSKEQATKDPGKYADTAVPALLSMMGVLPPLSNRLKAKLAGGANMFSSTSAGSLQIGEQNIAAVRQVLAALKIPICAEEVGGTKGRQLVIDAQTGKIVVKCIGQESKEL